MWNDLPAAEDVNYWKTGRTDPDAKLQQVCKLIEDSGGVIDQRHIMYQKPHEVVFVSFELQGAKYRIVWPVLKSDNRRAALIQAITFVYHDIKAKCMTATVLGPRIAFLPYYVTETGQTVSELATPALVESFPPLLRHES